MENIAGTRVEELSHRRPGPENGSSQSQPPHIVRADLGPKIRTFFMLPIDEIRHNQRSSGLNHAQSCWLTFGSEQAQKCSATVQATYLQLTLHPCVTQGQIRKM